MRKLFPLVFVAVMLLSCNQLPAHWKQLEIHDFTIAVPDQWNADTTSDQEDSYIGRIVGPGITLSFDDSGHGYANALSQQFESVNIKIDSDWNYVYKTIWPKFNHKGMTGIYIHSRKSSMNFNLYGYNLSAQNETDALKAFKTIRFKQ